MPAWSQQIIAFMLVLVAALWLARRWLTHRQRNSCSHCQAARSHPFAPLSKRGIRSPKLHILTDR